MKISFLTPMRCHFFDLAKELEKSEHETSIICAYPKWKLQAEPLKTTKLNLFPWVFTTKLALERFGMCPPKLRMPLERLTRKTLEIYAKRHLENTDILESLSSFGNEAGKYIKAQGGKYIVHRGSAHAEFQRELLREEFKRWKQPIFQEDDFSHQRELEDYEVADIINVPSNYARETFIKIGVKPNKIIALPYGADPSAFYPTTKADKNRFDAIFVGDVSLRKGFPYLLKAFAKLKHPNKKLTVVGKISPEIEALLPQFDISNVEFVGRQPRDSLKNYMSKSHVMVLPSIDDGFGKVITEAMACGCPVICSEHTGAPGYIENGKEGFIIPIRDVDSLYDKMQQIIDEPDLQDQMRSSALARIKEDHGWGVYAQKYLEIFRGKLK